MVLGDMLFMCWMMWYLLCGCVLVLGWVKYGVVCVVVILCLVGCRGVVFLRMCC